MASRPCGRSRECFDWCGLADREIFADLVSKDRVGMIVLAFTVEVSLGLFGETGLGSTSSNGVPKDGRGGGDSKVILF